MKKLYTTLLCITATLYVPLEAVCPVAPLISPRSQSVNAARELVGLTNQICIFDMEKFYGTFAITPEYMSSFKDDHVTQCLFGDSIVDCTCRNIRISGSSVADRGPKDWLADYFGLPTDFESCITFKPRVKNYLVDFYLYLGLDEWLCGLFCFIHAPVVNTRWDLNFCESNEAPGTTGYPIGYFGPEAVNRSQLRNSFTEYVTDCNGLDLGDDVFIEPLKFARMSPDSKNSTALSDIRFAVGWNFFQDEDYHLGLGILGAAPTGTQPKGEYLFEPMVGNGHHWELGGLVWGHIAFWRSECEEKFFAGWIQANITHMLKAHQSRFFDLQCKPNSRYMLAERMDTPVNLLLADTMPDSFVNSTVPSNQFKQLFAPVANLTRQDVDVTVGVQADIVVMLSYTSCGFNWDIGYNFWARTCEKIEPHCSCPPRIENEKWALKGDAYVFGFTDREIDVTIPIDTPVALSATQSNATIHSGTNVTTIINMIPVTPNQNPVIDNRQWAVAGENEVATALLLDQPAGGQTGTSKDPVLITLSDIDFKGAQTQGLSQKVFTHFSYSWLDNEDWTPYIGAGAEIEFAQNSDHCDEPCTTNPCSSACDNTCSPQTTCFTCEEDNCQKCALSQWGVWIKGGISFN